MSLGRSKILSPFCGAIAEIRAQFLNQSAMIRMGLTYRCLPNICVVDMMLRRGGFGIARGQPIEAFLGRNTLLCQLVRFWKPFAPNVRARITCLLKAVFYQFSIPFSQVLGR